MDSDWAGDKASGNNRSRTGVVILLNGLPVFWRSNKQPETAISSAQAEIYALSEAVRGDVPQACAHPKSNSLMACQRQVSTSL